NPSIDHIIDCDDKSLSGLRKLRASLDPLRPQAGLLLTNTTHSLLSFRFAGISRIYGYKRNLRRFFLTDGPLPECRDGRITPVPMQDYYLNLCRFLGLEAPDNPGPALFISDSLAEIGEQQLQCYGIEQDDLVIGLNPGASFGSSKCWPANYYARLAELLQKKFACKLLLLAGPGEQDIAARIINASNSKIINTAEDNIDLALLKPIIRRCNLLITNDTGPRHYAVAFNLPTIVLMGPTNPVYTATNLEYTSVLRRDLPCMPCHKKVCPLGHHACMTEITPEMVFSRVQDLLAGNRL
ncbi:MAG: glycosyltransferase family 9 protein, partial [Pseudohongiellaceae bacterium]